jgi:hypothetical protein
MDKFLIGCDYSVTHVIDFGAIRKDAAMPKKKLRRTSVSLDGDTERLAKTLIEHHKAASMTDYLRGLVVLDALIMQESVDLPKVPTWLLASYSLNVQEGKIQPVHLSKGRAPTRS